MADEKADPPKENVDECEVPPLEVETAARKVSSFPGGAKRDSYFKHRDYDSD
jgi:hypothetical protein